MMLSGKMVDAAGRGTTNGTSEIRRVQAKRAARVGGPAWVCSRV